MKACNNCKEKKPSEAFYKLRSNVDYLYTGKTWLSNDCKKCKNKMDHQRVLAKRLEQGMPVVNCSNCDMLMMKMRTRKICLTCFRESLK